MCFFLENSHKKFGFAFLFYIVYGVQFITFIMSQWQLCNIFGRWDRKVYSETIPRRGGVKYVFDPPSLTEDFCKIDRGLFFKGRRRRKNFEVHFFSKIWRFFEKFRNLNGFVTVFSASTTKKDFFHFRPRTPQKFGDNVCLRLSWIPLLM